MVVSKKYKSSLNRLAKFFEDSRDKWRARAKRYQAEKRKLQYRNRDLERMLVNYKRKCSELEKGISEKKKESVVESVPSTKITAAVPEERLPTYSFPIWQQLLAIQIYMTCSCGFRGTARMFELMQPFFDVKPMSYSSIRGWVLRLGYGLLHQPVQRRDDWVYIMDFSIQLGRERCLLVLGVTRESLKENGYELDHKQMNVLDIIVKPKFTGETVHDNLSALQQKTGTPYQVVSDGGSDITKGIKLFGEQHPSLIQTYDVSHMVGVVLKSHLQEDIRWKELQEDLRTLSQEVAQTEMSFLRPLPFAKKARWMNIQKQVVWLRNICNYEDSDDFSLIQTGYKIENNAEVLEKLKPFCKNKKKEYQIKNQIDNLVFENKDGVFQWVEESCNSNDMATEDVVITDAGKQRFQQKFNILDKHKPFINELEQIVNVAETAKRTVSKKGLSLDVLQEIEELQTPQLCSNATKVLLDINNRLQEEHAKCGTDKTPLLCCSDVIESIFGKFKMKAKQSVGGIYETVLNIAVSCNEITEEVIKKTLPSIKMDDVNHWFLEMAGKSNLAKRRCAFKRIKPEGDF